MYVQFQRVFFSFVLFVPVLFVFVGFQEPLLSGVYVNKGNGDLVGQSASRNLYYTESVAPEQAFAWGWGWGMAGGGGVSS